MENNNRVVKVGKRLALILPDDVIKELSLKDGSKLEVKHVHGNVYAIYPTPNEENKMMEEVVEEVLNKEKLGEDEITLLRKLKSIKFSDRTGNGLKKILNKNEFELLKKLMRRGIILHMTSGKYKSKGGVYSISKSYFPLIKTNKPERKEDENKLVKEVESRGYLITKSLEELDNARHKIDSGEFVLVKGFDGFYYLIKSQLLSNIGNKVIDLLKKGPMSLEEISVHLKRDKELVKAIMEVLREAGDVMERKKGVYELV